MDNQCANIFSTHATICESHSAMFAFYWKREYFFSMCILNLIFFKNFVSFYLSPPLLFFPKTVFPKTCFVFPIFIGGEVCFYPLLFIGGVVSISYRVELFCVPFFLYFLLLCCVCFLSTLCLSCLCQCVTKRGRDLDEMCGKYKNVLFRGS